MSSELHFAQAFGERSGDGGPTVQDVDLISAVRFSPDGDMVATGDKGGRVVILKAIDTRVDAEHIEFRFWTQFQSHEPEFDYLKSMEIEEKINRICWLSNTPESCRILSANDKTIKFFRVDERAISAVDSTGGDYVENGVDQMNGCASFQRLQLPKVKSKSKHISSHCARDYSNAHAYHINSLSVSSDEETFLSADDLRVNLWHVEQGDSGFNVLDIKPDNMEDLNEVITIAEFHPEHCSLFAVSTSRAIVKLLDLRMSSLCDSPVREFAVPEEMATTQSFFSEIVASISDLKFSPDGRYFACRDYETIRLWDVRRESEPLKTFPVFDELNARLVELYENECIFDRFQCAFSDDGSLVVTGSYNGIFCSFSARNGEVAAVEASVDFVSGASGKHLYSSDDLINDDIARSSVAELVEPTKRIMHLDACPTRKIYAVAAGPALYIFHS